MRVSQPCPLCPARILQQMFPVKVIILCAIALAAVVVILATRAIRRNAGVPPLDDPKNVTPPPARDMSRSGQTERGAK